MDQVPVETSRARARTRKLGRSATHSPPASVAVVGLGYVGLPTALSLHVCGLTVLGLDASARCLEAIARHDVDLLDRDHERLALALADERFQLTTDERCLRAADVVIVCVPTPVDELRRPDTTALRAACASVVRHGRRGQVLILTSTSHVGATRELLIEPLADRGLEAGADVHVAFSPERVDPGNERHPPDRVPRVVGADHAESAERAASVIGRVAPELHVVSSPEAAELTKLYENTFRAVNIAFANEVADLCRHHGLDPIEITEAAATKPYGFLPFYPGAGVGGHCIPCDPHYMLWPLHRSRRTAPLTELAMAQIDARPQRMIQRAVELLRLRDRDPQEARVLVVGASYKPGIRDVRHSPGVEILLGLKRLGARVAFYDPMIHCLDLEGLELDCVEMPDDGDYDLIVIASADPDSDYEWLDGDAPVLDCTYRVAAHGAEMI